MYGLTRGTVTLIGVVVAGLLLWLASEIFHPFATEPERSNGAYWAFVGLVAAAGLVIALSQLLGGWTKWGRPRVSLPVFLLGFLPAFIASFWIIGLIQPDTDNWLARRLGNWTEDLGISGFLENFFYTMPALAFGTGLVFGLVFDTSGPRRAREIVHEEAVPPPAEPAEPAEPAGPAGPVAAEETVVRERDERQVVMEDDAEATVADERRVEIVEGGTPTTHRSEEETRIDERRVEERHRAPDEPS